MYEMHTPKELIKEIVQMIEKERRHQNIQQKELALKASIPFPTYKDFIYKNKISFESLLKLLFALKMFENISGLMHKKEYRSIEEIKNKNKLPKRIRK